MEYGDRMQIFVSWSGARSQQVACALCAWLPEVIAYAKPWTSTEMAKGATWPTELAQRSTNAAGGIICVTPENQQSPWLLFEAGAIANRFTNKSAAWLYLIGMEPSNLSPPLSLLHATIASKEDARRLPKTIYKKVALALWMAGRSQGLSNGAGWN
ncbi:MAG: hypothetical protein HC897_11710 [Thermoanaerobaculia bacterium]|nr:hypothetical protein [Thermoanaerobaculia bacterium]